MAYPYPPGGAYPPGAYPPGAGYLPPGGAYPPGAYPPGAGVGGRRLFLIISERNGEALDIRGGHAGPGTEVITFHRKAERCANQLWWADPSGVIRSALNDFALDARPGDHVRMMPFTGQPDQLWVFAGNRIINRARPVECLTDKNGDRPVHAKEYRGKPKQHWRVEYVM